MKNLEPFLTDSIKSEIIQHMLAEAPRECCGYIRKTDKGYDYVKVVNVHREPEKGFKMSKEDSAIVATNDNIISIVHSHPEGPVGPSKMDMQMQMAIDKPFVIAAKDPPSGRVGVYSFGDHLLDYPLMGRPWLYGVFDCMEAFRSWFWQERKIYLPRMPRIDGWWHGDQSELDEDDRDMYVRNMEGYGFEEFSPNMSDPTHRRHPRRGDILLMQYDSPCANHAAVYVGENTIYHHRFGKVSTTHPLGYFSDQGVIRKWCRHRSMM